MADRKMEIALIIAAYDKATRVVSRVTSASIAQLDKVQKASDRASKSAFAVAKDTGAAGLAIAAPIAMAVKEAANFQDKMADVGKVMGAKVGSTAFNQMSEEAKQLSLYLRKMPGEASALMAAIGQGGASRAELLEVSKIAGEMAIAFDLQGEAAGDAFMKTKNALGATVPQVKKLMDSINHLSDNDASKASDILTFMAAGGAGVSNTLKANSSAIAAFGSSLIAMGKSGAESATIMERFQKGVFKDAGMRSLYNAAGGGEKGLMAILEKGSKMSGQRQFEFFNNFGEYGTSIMQLSQSLDHVRANMKHVSREQNYLGSVTKEFNNRNSTAVGSWRELKASLAVATIEIGDALLPVLTKLMADVKPIITSVTTWIKNNRDLVATIMKGAAAVSAFLLVTSGVSAVVGSVFKAISLFSGGLGMFMKAAKAVQFGIFAMRYAFAFTLWPAITAATSAVWSFTAALLANPITWIVIGIAAVVTSIVLLYKNWDKVKAFFIDSWNKIKASFAMIVPFFKNMWERIKNVFISALVGVKNLFLKYHPYGIIYSNWDKILKFIMGLGGKFFNAGKNIVKSMIDGIKAMAAIPVQEIAKITKSMREYLPFSPAKKGAFMDLHKVKIVETILSTIKANPLVRAMATVTGAVANVGPSPRSSLASVGGPNITINFNPTITGGSSEDIQKILRDNIDYLVREIKKHTDSKNRTKF